LICFRLAGSRSTTLSRVSAQDQQP
jgi:hypothetical protein